MTPQPMDVVDYARELPVARAGRDALEGSFRLSAACGR